MWAHRPLGRGQVDADPLRQPYWWSQTTAAKVFLRRCARSAASAKKASCDRVRPAPSGMIFPGIRARRTPSPSWGERALREASLRAVLELLPAWLFPKRDVDKAFGLPWRRVGLTDHVDNSARTAPFRRPSAKRVGIARALEQDPEPPPSSTSTDRLASNPKTSPRSCGSSAEICRERSLPAMHHIHDVQTRKMFVRTHHRLRAGQGRLRRAGRSCSTKSALTPDLTVPRTGTPMRKERTTDCGQGRRRGVEEFEARASSRGEGRRGMKRVAPTAGRGAGGARRIFIMRGWLKARRLRRFFVYLRAARSRVDVNWTRGRGRSRERLRFVQASSRRLPPAERHPQRASSEPCNDDADFHRRRA